MRNRLRSCNAFHEPHNKNKFYSYSKQTNKETNKIVTREQNK